MSGSLISAWTPPFGKPAASSAGRFEKDTSPSSFCVMVERYASPMRVSGDRLIIAPRFQPQPQSSPLTFATPSQFDPPTGGKTPVTAPGHAPGTASAPSAAPPPAANAIAL